MGMCIGLYCQFASKLVGSYNYYIGQPLPAEPARLASGGFMGYRIAPVGREPYSWCCCVLLCVVIAYCCCALFEILIPRWLLTVVGVCSATETSVLIACIWAAATSSLSVLIRGQSIRWKCIDAFRPKLNICTLHAGWMISRFLLLSLDDDEKS